MRTYKYTCRKAKETDDVKAIAKYLHLTDPYIYPKICNDPVDENWVDLIDACMKAKDNVFYIDHLSVVLCDGNIVGIACVIPCGKKLGFEETVKIPDAFACSIPKVIEGYFAPLLSESADFDGYNIVNVCIDEAHRGKGVGSVLMSHCIKEYGTRPIHLDVIASNEFAVRLYQKWGFAIVNEYLGFSGDETNLPCYHMLYTPC